MKSQQILGLLYHRVIMPHNITQHTIWCTALHVVICMSSEEWGELRTILIRLSVAALVFVVTSTLRLQWLQLYILLNSTHPVYYPHHMVLCMYLCVYKCILIDAIRSSIHPSIHQVVYFHQSILLCTKHNLHSVLNDQL